MKRQRSSSSDNWSVVDEDVVELSSDAESESPRSEESNHLDGPVLTPDSASTGTNVTSILQKWMDDEIGNPSPNVHDENVDEEEEAVTDVATENAGSDVDEVLDSDSKSFIVPKGLGIRVVYDNDIPSGGIIDKCMLVGLALVTVLGLCWHVGSIAMHSPPLLKGGSEPVDPLRDFCDWDLPNLDKTYGFEYKWTDEDVHKFMGQVDPRTCLDGKAANNIPIVHEIMTRFLIAHVLHGEARQACSEKNDPKVAITREMLLAHTDKLEESLGEFAHLVLWRCDMVTLTYEKVHWAKYAYDRYIYGTNRKSKKEEVKKVNTKEVVKKVEELKKALSEAGNEWKKIEEAANSFSSTLKRTVPKIVDSLEAHFSEVADHIHEIPDFLLKLRKAMREAHKAREAATLA